MQPPCLQFLSVRLAGGRGRQRQCRHGWLRRPSVSWGLVQPNLS